MPIAPDVTLGNDVRIFQPELVNLYGCSIADETKIGAFVEIQKNASIGAHLHRKNASDKLLKCRSFYSPAPPLRDVTEVSAPPSSLEGRAVGLRTMLIGE